MPSSLRHALFGLILIVPKAGYADEESFEILPAGLAAPSTGYIQRDCPNVSCVPWFTRSSRCKKLNGYTGAYKCYVCTGPGSLDDCNDCIVRFTTAAEADLYCTRNGISRECINCVREPHICWYKTFCKDITVHKCIKKHDHQCKEECKNGECRIIDCDITIKKLEPCEISWNLAKQYIEYDNVWIVIHCKCP